MLNQRKNSLSIKETKGGHLHLQIFNREYLNPKKQSVCSPVTLNTLVIKYYPLEYLKMVYANHPVFLNNYKFFLHLFHLFTLYCNKNYHW